MTTKTLPLLGLCAAAALAAAGCGSSSGDTTTAATTSAAATKTVAAASTGTAGLRSTLEKAFAGTDRALPTSSPAPAKGKSVWVISCSQAAPGCAVPAAGAEAAAKAIGWTVKVADGKFDPATYNQQVRAAVAAKADAIVLDVIDCVAVQGSLKAAKAANVKVFGLAAADCDDEYAGGGAKQFDGQIDYAGKTYTDFVKTAVAPAIATYVAVKNPKAHILALTEDDAAIIHHLNDGFATSIKTQCPGCTLVTAPITGADLVTNKLQSITSAMLTKDPKIDTVVAPYDATILLGVGAAVGQARARGGKVLLTGLEGLPPNIALIKAGQQDLAAGVPSRWAGWAAIDGLNRVFAGQPQVDAGIGFQLVTKDRNLPTGTNGYDGNDSSAGYEANYQKLWKAG